MLVDSGWFSATRGIGLASFAASSAVCLYRWAQCRRTSTKGRVFAILAGIELALLLDMAFDWRWKLHDAGIAQATAFGIYSVRRGPQLTALETIAGVSVLASVVVLFGYRRRRGAAVAAFGVILSCALWGVEVISYHFTDRVLYAKTGGVMWIALVWVGLAAMTCIAAWLDG